MERLHFGKRPSCIDKYCNGSSCQLNKYKTLKIIYEFYGDYCIQYSMQYFLCFNVAQKNKIVLKYHQRGGICYDNKSKI